MFERLLLAHLVGDFVLQTRAVVRRKRTPAGLALHTGLVGLAMLPVIWDRWATWWPWVLVILATHAATDWAKICLEPRLRCPPILPFLADQVVHLLMLAVVVALAGATGLPVDGTEPAWWIASAYLGVTFALSIALTVWLDPPNLMHRPPVARLMLMAGAALALTLAWRGQPLLVPAVGLGLYQIAARRLAKSPAASTLGLEFLCAVVVASSLGWILP